MSQKSTSDLILECYRRADEARRIATAAVDASTKADFLEVEPRWLSLARSYRPKIDVDV